MLYAIPFDLEALDVRGGPVAVIEGVRATGSGIFQFDVSATGDLVYLPGLAEIANFQFSLAVADRAGGANRVGTPPGPFGVVRASPDGKRLAVDSDDGSEAIVHIYDLSGTSAMRRLTFEGRNQLPVWSPDGERIAFQSDRGGDLAIYVQRADGTGGAQRLTTAAPGERHIPESWSPDGKHLSLSVVAGATSTLWVLSLETGTTARFNDVQSVEPIGSVFSPDGRWIAYHALSSDAVLQSRGALTAGGGVFVEPFPATGARYQVPKVARDFQPVWARDGRELYLRGHDSVG